jgi:membrane-associated phospholipid phosphatase
MDAIQQFGLHFIAAFQSLGEGLLWPMRIATTLGTEPYSMLVISLIYWCVDSAVGVRAGVLLCVGDEVNLWAKWAFHGPRPYWLDPALQRGVAGGYGFPSGHAQGAVMLWLYLASRVRRAWAWAVAVALVLAISASRLYLGVHFPHDVAAGWVLGGVCIGVFLWLSPHAGRWVKTLPIEGVIAVAVVAAAAMLAVSRTVLALIAGIADPPQWSLVAAHVRDFSSAATAPGVLAGAILGYVLQERCVRFDARGTAPRRAARFIVGIAGLALILRGAAAATAGLHGSAALALRLACCFLTTLWVTCLGPLVFVKIGLAGVRPLAQSGTVSDVSAAPPVAPD